MSIHACILAWRAHSPVALKDRPVARGAAQSRLQCSVRRRLATFCCAQSLTWSLRRSLHFASAMLSDRFGVRNRTYVVHTQKTVSKPLLLEMVGLFADELEPSVRRFRATGHDTNVWFLL